MRQAARPLLPAAMPFLLLAGLLSSCTARVDEIRMRIDEREKGALVALASAPLSSARPELGRGILPVADLENQSGYRELNRYVAGLSRCAISHRLYQQRTRVRLDLRAPFEDVDDLNSIFSCGAYQFEQPAVAFERDDGFLWNSYVTRFEITQLSERCPDAGPCNHLILFPRLITLSVPGSIDQVDPNSADLVGFDVQRLDVDDDTVQLTVNEVADYAAVNRRYFAGRRDRVRRDVLKIEIRSSRLNYDLNTIISVIGVIFGSGLLIQMSRRFLFRKPEESPNPPKRRRAARKPAQAP